MKLTKDDLSRICGRDCSLEEFNQIRKNQEDAEKFRETQQQLYYRNYKIVERLKNQLESDFSIQDDENTTEFIFRLRKTLSNCQKILEGKE